MMDYGPVKLWLEAVQNRMNDMFNKSNLYQSLPQLYGSLGTYSTGAMAVLEDDEDIIRTMPFPIGSYYWLTHLVAVLTPVFASSL